MVRVLSLLILLILPLFSTAQCEVFVEPESVEVIDNGEGVMFEFQITNNSSELWYGDDLLMNWSLNASALIMPIQLSDDEPDLMQPLAPGQSMTLSTPYIDLPNLPSFFPTNPSNDNPWMESLDWPYYTLPIPFNGTWTPINIRLGSCGLGSSAWVYDEGELYYGPFDSNCQNNNDDIFCDCDVTLLNYNPDTYDITISVNSGVNCGCNYLTDDNYGNCYGAGGIVNNNESINSFIMGLNVQDLDENWLSCLTSQYNPGWAFAFGVNNFQQGWKTGDIVTKTLTPNDCWVQMQELAPNSLCLEMAIWQINLSQTASINDFPENGWAATCGICTDDTQMYPDIDISDNSVVWCFDEDINSPDATPAYAVQEVECQDGVAVNNYTIRVLNVNNASSSATDTLWSYCVEIPEIGLDTCLDGTEFPVYYIEPNGGQVVFTDVFIPNEISEFTINVYFAEDELDEFQSNNSIVVQNIVNDTEDVCNIEGCTLTWASNYDPEATTEDGSCIFLIDLALDTILYETGCDEFGAYWSPTFYLTNEGESPITEFCITEDILSTLPGNDTICFDFFTIQPGETYEMQWPNMYEWGVLSVRVIDVNGASGNSWNSFGLDGDVGDNMYVQIITDEPQCNPGCTDETASNYDEGAVLEDGSCEYITDASISQLLLLFGCDPELGWYFIPSTSFNNNGPSTINQFSINVSVYDPDQIIVLTEDILNVNITSGGQYDWQGDSVFVEDFNIDIPVDLIDLEVYNVNDEIITQNNDISFNGPLIQYMGCLIEGCTDPEAVNFNISANVDDGSCSYNVFGCTDSIANNYNPDATVDDGSCTFDINGCTDANANNYNPDANVDDGSCEFDVYGCTDPSADNYDPLSNVDDGSCFIEGCTIEQACNYNPEATVNDGSCDFESCVGCMDPEASNYDPIATVSNPSLCIYDVLGCTDIEAVNYNPSATLDDGSCIEAIVGCMVPIAINYNPLANVTCVPIDECCEFVEGCTDPAAMNYNPDAIIEDESCVYDVLGCTDVNALNFNPFATVDDGSCLYYDPCNDDYLPVYVPNIFTPNSDGINDTWQIITNSECWLDWNVKIFNRWGNMIYEMTSPDQVWDGTVINSDGIVSDGVYVCVIRARRTNSAAYQNTTEITVLK